MGQRSAIIVRINNYDDNKAILFARYYQWNYSRGMIGRARSIIEYLNRCGQYLSALRHPHYQEEFVRYMDVDFDKRDICISHDIVAEDYSEQELDKIKIRDIVNEVDNDDGFLLIDVWGNRNGADIYYSFLTNEDYDPRDSEDYLKWDQGDHFFIDDIIRRNIEYIEGNAHQLTNDDLEKFLDSPIKEEIPFS